jgi:hypothetical protein
MRTAQQLHRVAAPRVARLRAVRHVPGHPDVNYVSNDEIVNGKRITRGETFHTDHSNHPRPPKATMPFAAALPSSGGGSSLATEHDVAQAKRLNRRRAWPFSMAEKASPANGGMVMSSLS